MYLVKPCITMSNCKNFPDVRTGEYVVVSMTCMIHVLGRVVAIHCLEAWGNEDKFTGLLIKLLDRMVGRLETYLESARRCYDQFSSPVGTEQRWFRGWRDLDYSAPRVRWLPTPLHGKAEAQGTRPSKPKKKGTHPIRNSRGLAARVQMTSIGFRQGIGHLPVSITWVGPCQRWEDVDGGIEVVLDEGQRWASWGWVRDRTWMGSDHNEKYQRWYSDWGIQRLQRLLILDDTRDRDLEGVVWV